MQYPGESITNLKFTQLQQILLFLNQSSEQEPKFQLRKKFSFKDYKYYFIHCTFEQCQAFIKLGKMKDQQQDQPLQFFKMKNIHSHQTWTELTPSQKHMESAIQYLLQNLPMRKPKVSDMDKLYQTIYDKYKINSKDYQNVKKLVQSRYKKIEFDKMIKSKSFFEKHIDYQETKFKGFPQIMILWDNMMKKSFKKFGDSVRIEQIKSKYNVLTQCDVGQKARVVLFKGFNQTTKPIIFAVGLYSIYNGAKTRFQNGENLIGYHQHLLSWLIQSFYEVMQKKPKNIIVSNIQTETAIKYINSKNEIEVEYLRDYKFVLSFWDSFINDLNVAYTRQEKGNLINLIKNVLWSSIAQKKKAKKLQEQISKILDESDFQAYKEYIQQVKFPKSIETFIGFSLNDKSCTQRQIQILRKSKNIQQLLTAVNQIYLQQIQAAQVKLSKRQLTHFNDQNLINIKKILDRNVFQYFFSQYLLAKTWSKQDIITQDEAKILFQFNSQQENIQQKEKLQKQMQKYLQRNLKSQQQKCNILQFSSQKAKFNCRCKYKFQTGIGCVHQIAYLIQNGRKYDGIINERWKLKLSQKQINQLLDQKESQIDSFNQNKIDVQID